MLLLDPLAHPIIAHRGNRAFAPENTMLAFEQALAAGAEAFEIDVHLTRDGAVVVCHDETVDRTTNGTGAIAALSLAQVREFDAGRGQRIPLLSEVLDAFSATPLIIDFKARAVTDPAIAVLHRANARDRVLIGSFPDEQLAAPRRAGFHTTASLNEMWRLLPRAFVGARAGRVPFDAIAMPPTWYGTPLPIAGYVRAAGVPVHVWTINEPHRARRLWDRGVCGIVTDDPAKILKER